MWKERRQVERSRNMREEKRKDGRGGWEAEEEPEGL